MENSDLLQLSSKSDLLAKAEATSAETFLRSFFYTGIQAPISGAAQMLDKVAGTNTLPNCQLIDAPARKSFSAQLGSVAATAGHCALMLYAGHKIGGPVSESSLSSALQSYARRGAVTGGLGALYGGVLTPTAESGNSSFVKSRLENAAVGAAGLASMSVFSSFYKDTLAKGVSFADAPFYKGLLMPGSLAGLASIADTQLPNRENTVFLPASKLKPAEDFYPPNLKLERKER